MMIIRKQYIREYGQGDRWQTVYDFFHGSHAMTLRERLWVPKCDIYETADSILVCLEIAGVDEEEIQIAYDGESGIMLIMGHRHKPAENERKRTLQMEMVSGPFEKFIKMNVPIDEHKISASIKNGVLQVKLPKVCSATE